MRASYATKAYSTVDLATKTQNRRPEELIVLLFDKACSCLRRASMLPVATLGELELNERLALLEDFHKNTSKAMQIVVALREMLDMDAGGEVRGTREIQFGGMFLILNTGGYSSYHCSDTSSNTREC